MADKYKDTATTVSSPPRRAVAVTPSDTVDLTDIPKSLWIGAAGDLKVILADDTAAVVYGVAIGAFNRRVKRVYATGTTATKIIAEY